MKKDPQKIVGADLDRALALSFDFEGEETTVRGYLESLLMKVWEEGESFDGKRPFGNSGWEYDLYTPLVNAGFIDGELDEDGYIDSVGPLAHAFVMDLIIWMCRTHAPAVSVPAAPPREPTE